MSIATFDPISAGGGSVQMNADGTFSYVSAVDFSGTDSFSYTVSDGHGGEDDALVTIEVAAASPANNAPIAVGDSYVSVAGVALENAGSVLANDSDPDGNPLSVIAYDTTSTGGGSVQMSADGMFTYAPTAGFTGGDSFVYTIGDGNGGHGRECGSRFPDPACQAIIRARSRGRLGNSNRIYPAPPVPAQFEQPLRHR